MSPGRCSKRKASDALVLAQIDDQDGVSDGGFGCRHHRASSVERWFGGGVAALSFPRPRRSAPGARTSAKLGESFSTGDNLSSCTPSSGRPK